MSKLVYRDLLKDADEVLRTLSTREKVVLSDSGLWYLTRIMPYRTVSNVIDGVVITFIDITEQKKAQEAFDSMVCAEGVVESFGTPLAVVDRESRILFANTSFHETFGVSRKKETGGRIHEVAACPWNDPGLRRLIEKILIEDTEVKDYAVVCNLPKLGRRKLLVSGRMISHKAMQTQAVFLSVTVTDESPEVKK